MPDVLHERILNLLHPNAANLSGNQRSVRVHGGGVSEEVSIAGVGLLQPGQLLRRIAGEPGGDLIHLIPGAALFLCLGHQQGVHLGKRHFCYIHLRHGLSSQQALVGGVDDDVHLHGGDIVSYNLQEHDSTTSRYGVIVPQMGLPGNLAKQERGILDPQRIFANTEYSLQKKNHSMPNSFLVISIILVNFCDKKRPSCFSARSDGYSLFMQSVFYAPLCGVQAHHHFLKRPEHFSRHIIVSVF